MGVNSIFQCGDGSRWTCWWSETADAFTGRRDRSASLARHAETGGMTTSYPRRDSAASILVCRDISSA